MSHSLLPSMSGTCTPMSQRHFAGVVPGASTVAWEKMENLRMETWNCHELSIRLRPFRWPVPGVRRAAATGHFRMFWVEATNPSRRPFVSTSTLNIQANRHTRQPQPNPPSSLDTSRIVKFLDLMSCCRPCSMRSSMQLALWPPSEFVGNRVVKTISCRSVSYSIITVITYYVAVYE